MTDLSSLQTKINDLKAKVADNSISPSYLGALLDDFLSAIRNINPNIVEVALFDVVDTENALNMPDDKMTATVNLSDMAPSGAPIVMTWRDSRFFAKVDNGNSITFYSRFPGMDRFGTAGSKGVIPKPGVLYVSKSGSDRGRLFIYSGADGWPHLEQVDLDLRQRLENKVDKVEGKGLSTNDYTNAEKLKVNDISKKVDKVEGKGLSTNDYTNAEKLKVRNSSQVCTFDAVLTPYSNGAYPIAGDEGLSETPYMLVLLIDPARSNHEVCVYIPEDLGFVGLSKIKAENSALSQDPRVVFDSGAGCYRTAPNAVFWLKDNASFGDGVGEPIAGYYIENPHSWGYVSRIVTSENHNVVFFDSVDTENALNVSDENMTAVLNRTDYAPADAPTVMTWRDSRFFAKVGDVFYEKFHGSRQFGAQDGKGIAPKPGVLYVSKSGSNIGRLFTHSDSGGWSHLEQADLDIRNRLDSLDNSVARIPTVQNSVHGTPSNYIYSKGDESLTSVMAAGNTTLLQSSGALVFRAYLWNPQGTAGYYYSRVVPIVNTGHDGVMSRDVFNRLGTGASIYEQTATPTSVTVSYPNWAAGGNRTFMLNAATTARAGVMTAAMVKRLSAAETAASDAQEASVALAAEVEALRQQVYDVTTRPQIEAELTAMGWDTRQIEAAFATNPQMTRGQLELRRGLLELDYTVAEVEECMEDVPALTQDDISYARSLMEAWDPATTDMTETYKADTRIVVFPKIDTSNVTRMHRTWGGCTNMRYMPLLDVSASTYCRSLFTEEETDNIVPLRRLPAFNFASMTGPANPCTLADLRQVEIIPLIRFKGNANMWNVFIGCLNVKEFGGIECDWETVREIAQMFGNWRSFDHLPLTNLHKCSGNNVQLFTSLGAGLPEPIDLSGEALTADEGVEISLRQVFRWANLCGLPRLDIPAVSSMESAFEGIEQYTVMPDYSHLRPTNVAYLVGSQHSTCKLERIEGLNFERVTSMDHMLSYHNSNGYCPKLKYMRIINLGKSDCTTYPFYSAENWGAGSAENLQSLVDTLFTNSFDRATATMATATVKLPAATLARLTEEQKAAITAKGYTLAQI